MRCPFAIWRGTIPNETPGGMESPVVGVVFHIMGASYEAADSWFHNPSAQASAHFGIKQDGTLVQWVDTADRAWHAAAANRHWIGVETEGSGGALSEAGCQTFARLYRWLHDTHGVPFQITDDPNSGHGFGWHGMGGSAWGGHDYCPGPERRAQRAHILQLAQGTQGEDDVLNAEEHAALLDMRNKISDLHQVALNEQSFYGTAVELLDKISKLLDKVVTNTARP